mmetsp:Transcript_7232/g.13035  ORF Transcript_7232/g.13035 Transcript_7232/m.13035 type:complete len:96 (+) Transcript_7232:268-555(+)
METITAVVQEPGNNRVLQKFVVFSILIIVLPIITFFGAKYIALQHSISLGFLGIHEQNAGTVLAAFIAIGVVNLLMIAFVISAIAEDDSHKPKQQ